MVTLVWKARGEELQWLGSKIAPYDSLSGDIWEKVSVKFFYCRFIFFLQHVISQGQLIFTEEIRKADTFSAKQAMK